MGADGPGKVTDLASAASLIPDGATITIGGVLLHRSPAALVRELARQGKRGLHLVKPSPAYDLDLLCAASCLASAEWGITTFEPPLGLLPSFRKEVESGRVEAREHT